MATLAIIPLLSATNRRDWNLLMLKSRWLEHNYLIPLMRFKWNRKSGVKMPWICPELRKRIQNISFKVIKQVLTE